MNRGEIMRILPHREPMLLIDEAILQQDGTAFGSYTVRGDEWFLQGHFPGRPVVPGVILCEMMAQTCCVLLSGRLADGLPFFAGMEKVRFLRPVLPGERVEFVCVLKKQRHPFYFAEGVGRVGPKKCVSASLSVALQPWGAQPATEAAQG